MPAASATAPFLALLIGSGLRRAELVGLKKEDFQVRVEHWVVADLIGKRQDSQFPKSTPLGFDVLNTLDAGGQFWREQPVVGRLDR
jgi:integrase